MEAIPEDSPLHPRVMRLRGVVFNRLKDPTRALEHLHLARQAAIAQQNLAEIVHAGREITVVHAWRGEDRDAARALLRAVAVAYLNDDHAATDPLRLAEAGRIELEARRFDEAARLFRLVADLKPPALGRHQVFRVRINLCQALNRCRRHQEVLELAASLGGGLDEARSMAPDECGGCSYSRCWKRRARMPDWTSWTRLRGCFDRAQRPAAPGPERI